MTDALISLDTTLDYDDIVNTVYRGSWAFLILNDPEKTIPRILSAMTLCEHCEYELSLVNPAHMTDTQFIDNVHAIAESSIHYPGCPTQGIDW